MEIIEACEGRINRGAHPSETCKKNRLFAIMEKYYPYDGVTVPVTAQWQRAKEFSRSSQGGGVSCCEKIGKTFSEPQKKEEGGKNVLPPQQRKNKKVTFREDREEEKQKMNLQKTGGRFNSEGTSRNQLLGDLAFLGDLEISQKCYLSDVKIGARPPKVVPSPIFEVNLAAIAIELRVKVRSADMPPVQQELAFRCGRKCLDSPDKIGFRMVALTLKKEFDKCYGPAWHCIVGRSFGSFVTHSPGGFLYFSMDKVSILLFRTAVEPIGQ
ncbi:hypothetical protein SUGI_0299090 [Cryptomeria japonica]|uniref:uncharacterized protein LOC131064318 n=1 Tax=Cryptomeria japonica TaxID=3369 RepID=UPI0024089DD6|nr:uncharacterized protein LOC131064318 [Cryptomeria japonica]GLJ17248.1 hypothetical protein SUGI_0299090 [Cryptomeria japonica]